MEQHPSFPTKETSVTMHTQKKHIQLILSISLYGKNDVKMNQIHLEKVKNLIHLLKDFAISILNSSVDS
jgi:hypothetical protein